MSLFSSFPTTPILEWHGVSLVRRFGAVVGLLHLLLVGCPVAAQSWVPLASGTGNDLTAVTFFDAQHGYITGAFSTVLKTSDGGGTWIPVRAPVSASFVSVAAKSADDFFIGRVGLHRSRDGGKNWDVDVGGFEAYASSIFDILLFSDTEGLFVKDGGIFATEDGGENWTLQSGTGLFLDDLQHAGGDVFFATGGITYSEIFGLVSRGDMARSKDRGRTWEVLTATGINEIHAVVWRDQNVGQVFTFTNKSHQTADGGDTWELVADVMRDTEGTPLPAIIMDAVLDPTGRIVAVDFNGNFLESVDGATWEVTRGTGEPMTALTRRPDGAIVAVGNSGAIWIRLPPTTDPGLPLGISAIEVDAAKGKVTLAATGTPGLQYQLLVSTDLIEWVPAEVVKPATAQFSITVDVTRGTDAAFYRLVELEKPIGP